MWHNLGNRRLAFCGLAVSLALAFLLGGFTTVAWAKDLVTAYPPGVPLGPLPPAPSPPARRLPSPSWCLYPVRPAEAQSKTAANNARVVKLDEVEPNEDAAQAQFLAISSVIGNEIDVTVKGSISEGADVDFYRVFVNRGDVLGLVVTTNRDLYDFRPDLGLDPVVAICDLTEDVIVFNDDDGGLSSMYPRSSPLPRIVTPLYDSFRWDSALSWVAPDTGDYLIRVTSSYSSRRGDYELKIVCRRPSCESQAVGATQILFLDFDGVQDFNAVEVFGDGRYLTDLSPMRDFLPDWGLTRADESAVIDAVIASVQERLDDIRTADLNGDRDLDFIDGHMDYEIRNSRDHADPWGQPNVTRAIIGGWMYELGFGTVGIAQSIDPGNFDHEETVVLLLDILSDPDPTNTWSVNNIPRSGDFTIIDAIGRAVGFGVAHELGHTLGLWHTDPNNPVPCVIDGGGRESFDYYAGAGPDGVLGTGDDEFLGFVPDEYVPNEAWYYPPEWGLFLNIATGIEFTNVRTAFGLATGTDLNVQPPPPPPADVARVSISAMPRTGQAPLTVSFAGGGIDPAGGEFIAFNWNFGDQTTGAGAFVTHTYTRPGTYIVTLSGTTNTATTAQTVAEVLVLSQPNQLPQASIIASPTKGNAPLLVLFEAQAVDPDGSVIGYAWDFGDGQSGTGQVIDHVFVTPGVYVVTLSVTDNLGAVKRVTLLITVLGSPSSGGTSWNRDGQSGLPIPSIGGCGAGVSPALAATLAGMLGMALMRRRH